MDESRPKHGDEFEPDPDDFRIEAVGALHQLSDKNPPGEPFKHKTYPMGFDLRPGVHKRKHRKWRRVSPAK